MAENSFMFDNNAGDRQYNAQNFADQYKAFFGTGVLAAGSNLLATVTDLTHVALPAGKAVVEGRYYENTASLSLAVATTSTTRVDRLVLRSDTNTANRYVKAFIVQGTSTVAPTLTRSGTVYEISIAKINVTPTALTITDERLDISVCGIAGIQVATKTTYYGNEMPYTNAIAAGATLTKNIAIGSGKLKGVLTIQNGDTTGITIYFNSDITKTRCIGSYQNDLVYSPDSWTVRSLGTVTTYTAGGAYGHGYGYGCSVSGNKAIIIQSACINGTNIEIVFKNTDTASQSLNCTIDWEVE